MLPTQEPMIRIQDLGTLRRGDTVEARHYGTVRYRGQIDAVVPHLGVLWLHHGPWKERTLLDATEYDIWKVPGARPFSHDKTRRIRRTDDPVVEATAS